MTFKNSNATACDPGYTLKLNDLNIHSKHDMQKLSFWKLSTERNFTGELLLVITFSFLKFESIFLHVV